MSIAESFSYSLYCRNDFSQLLAGGRVDFSSSAQFASEHSFRDLLTRITFVGHFSGEYYVFVLYLSFL